MINAIKKIFWKREMTLFDTGIFILKSFVTIFAGYAIFNSNTYLGKDMISLLFGAMLTLEPVNISGLKKGFELISASIIGGVIAAVIVMIGGINCITVPLAISLTLYITLRINWRSMSVIAVFTSIYMTMLVQYNSIGQPSMPLTLQLRLLSLGTGILLAVLANFIFSLFSYRAMLRKRIVYVLESTVVFVEKMSVILQNNDDYKVKELRIGLREIFVDIDQISVYVKDISKNKRKMDITQRYMKLLMKLRDFNHYLLDMIMVGSDCQCCDHEIECLKIMKKRLISLCDIVLKKQVPEIPKSDCESNDRNIKMMNECLIEVYTILNLN